MKRTVREVNFVIDKETNNEILYWISRKGWDERKVILSKYSWTEEDEHECCSHGQCKRCANNKTMHFRSIEFSPFNSKDRVVLESHCGDTIGSIWSNYYYSA